MTNNLKLLLTPEQAISLKVLLTTLEAYQNMLKPLQDTFANEARRAINYNRRIEVALREGEKIIIAVKSILS